MIANFLHSRYHESKWIQQKESIKTQADCIKMLIPNLVGSLSVYLRNITDHLAKNARDIFSTAVENNINGIVSTFKHLGRTEKSNNGEFLSKMDRIFAMIDETDDENVEIEEFDQLTEWVIRHSLTVAKSSGDEDEKEITPVCQKIIAELNICKRELTTQSRLGQQRRQEFGNLFELLEQNVNGALLSMVISCLPGVGKPLDELMAKITKSDLDPKDRLSDDLSEEIIALDMQTDKLLQLCHFCIFCTYDQEKAQKIRSIGKLLETLEVELVPGLLQHYFNPSNLGARSLVNNLMKTWKTLLGDLSSVMLGIVDPTAYCVILLQEISAIAKSLRDNLYSQDVSSLNTEVNKLVCMAETGVDLAWREFGSQVKEAGVSIQPLPDTHPLVTTERSIWEVRAASKLVISTVEDLSLHSGLQKRVQVLVTAFSDVAQLLTDKQEEDSQGCLSNIISDSLVMGHASEMTLSPAVTVSRPASTCLSFRAVRNMNKTAALAQDLRRDVYRLTVDLTPFTPRAEKTPKRSKVLTRKPSKVTVNGCILETPIKRSEQGSRIVRQSSARLSSVINELSVLSHELSVCIEASQDENTDKENMQECKESDKNTKNNSLRRAALKNLTNKVTLTSASKITI